MGNPTCLLLPNEQFHYRSITSFCWKSSGTLQVPREPELGLVEVEMELFILLTSLLEQSSGPDHHTSTQTELIAQVLYTKESSQDSSGSDSRDKIDCITIMAGEYETQYSRSFFPVG